MADTIGSIEFDSGRVNASLRFLANGAVGTYCPISKSQVAVATDDTRLFVRNGATITDQVAGPATGTIQFEINGDPIAVFLDQATQAATNSGRKKLNVKVPPNSWLRAKVVATLPA